MMKKVLINIAPEDQSISSKENVKVGRKSLKDIQKSATNKENLVGRLKKAEVHFVNKSVQTGEITVNDLTADEPSEDYWRLLAEKRGDALNDSLKENERLKDTIESLQEENKTCKEMLKEAQTMVEVLQDILNESQEEDEASGGE